MKKKLKKDQLKKKFDELLKVLKAISLILFTNFRKISKFSFLALGKSMVKLVEMKYFRPVAIVFLVCILCFNIGYTIKGFLNERAVEEGLGDISDVIEIQVLNQGKVLDIDQVQIYERIVESGDTVLGFLLDVGLEEEKVVQVLSALKKKLDPRDIVVGHSMIARYKVKMKRDDLGKITGKIVFLDEFKIVTSPEIEYVVTRDQSGDFAAKKVKHELVQKIARYKGKIEDGLFVDATKAGASANAVMNMISLYGYDVDFQRDIRSGDEFEMVVEAFYNEGGKKVKDGNVLFAMLDLANKRKIAMYAHRMPNGSLQYFDKKGYSVKKSLLRTPINGARVSSGFGFRKHPVLGYSKLHKGVDFAARRGTPIFAAGDGKIIYRGRYGGYGNFIKIRHNSTYQTAYAHMSKFNRRFRSGSQVKQGDVIGYVGTTGRSTGPHLHFEVIRRGKAINPSKVKSVSGSRLKGSRLDEFKKTVEKIEEYRKTIK